MSKRYCVIDFETTGLNPVSCEIIEFGAMKVEYGELGLNLASLCQPHGHISSQITGITGITPAMVMGKPYFEELLPLLLDFIGTDTLVAHNLPFDLGFLSAYCAKAGRRFTPPTLCTLALSRKLLPKLPNHKLGTVTAHFGIRNVAAHRALGDATATALLLIELLALKERPSTANA